MSDKKNSNEDSDLLPAPRRPWTTPRIVTGHLAETQKDVPDVNDSVTRFGSYGPS